MLSQSIPTGWATVILSCAVVTGAGVVVRSVAPSLSDSSHSDSGQGQSIEASMDAHPELRQPISMSVETPPLPPLDGQLVPPPLDSQMARYDNIVVEVKQDGTLRVLGEQMAVGSFKLLLDDQLREQLQTVVTIRADDNCLFRHVGPVISVCDEVGVPHLMGSTRAPAPIGPSSGGPSFDGPSFGGPSFGGPSSGGPSSGGPA